MKFLNHTRWPLKRIGTRSALIPTAVLLASIGFGYSSGTNGQVQQLGPPVKSGEKPVVAKTTKSKPTQFLRVTNDASGEPLALQTAITRYRPAKGDLVVDLIGAVHIGEREYYRQLNTQFELYDVVLYELVAPQGTRADAGGYS